MNGREDEFLKSLLTAFRGEAEEHLQAISAGLLELERSPAPDQQAALVERVYREAHSLKGAARAVNLADIERVCQSLESVFATWKRQESYPSAEALDVIHHALDMLHLLVASPETMDATQCAGMAQSLAHLPAGNPHARLAPEPRPETALAPAGGTIRVPTAKLEKLLREAESMLAVKLTSGQRAADLRRVKALFDPWDRERTKANAGLRALRQSLEKGLEPTASDAATLLEFLDWSMAHVKAIEHGVDALTAAAQQDHHVASRMVDDLLDDSKKLLMLPCGNLLGMLSRLVRDLCRAQGKEADLLMRGQEAELDKRILEEMKDPLVHLVRNCVDHGIETPERRAQQGKPPRGTISISVSELEGNKLAIQVSDDGAGIDVAKVKESAVKHGIVPAADVRQLGDAEALALIFQSEVSTSPIITELSGRGLGLAIVQEKAEKLGGCVSVETKPGSGTTFRIVLPVALATFRGVMVEAGGQAFVIPTANVERVMRVKADQIRTVENRETISVDGRAVSLARLSNVLELPAGKAQAADALLAAVLRTADKRIAFLIDALLDEAEVLFKPLGKPLSRVRNIAGATILGTGRIVPVLNVPDLMKSALRVPRVPSPTAVAPGQAEAKRISVLVVEDSITSRMLLKSILESGGYSVKTAVDGIDALTALRTEAFDVIVSDVQMPRMTGFELTAKIRSDKRLAEKPVILVTALETQADRERGIDVGANAYIVKSSFDQSNLLDAIRRLV